MKCAPCLPGCGTQHPHRALGGTRVLLATAPTTPPCFRRWRRSSLLQRKNYFKFWGTETPAGVSVPLFHGWGRKGKRQLPRLFPAETVARRGAPSPSQSPLVTALPKGEPLAWRHSFRLNCKVCGFARASPFGRGGIASAMTERASPLPGRGTPSVLPLRVKPPSPRGRLQAMPQSFPSRQRRPLGGAVTALAVTEGALFVPNSTFWGENRKRLSKVHKKAAQSLAGTLLTVPRRKFLRNRTTN